MFSQFETVYRVTANSVLDHSFWNGVFRNIDQRFIAIEDKKSSFEEAEQKLLDLGLRRINETIGPAAQTILNVAELGFLSASSEALLHPQDGQILSIPLIKDERVQLFTPSPFIALIRRSSVEGYAIGKLIHYDAQAARLDVMIVSVQDITQAFDDFDVCALAGSVKAMWDALQESRSLRDEVTDKHSDIALKSTDITGKHTDIANKHSDFVSTWYGARSSPPDGAKTGAMYLDIVQNPAVVMVKTPQGWSIAALAAENVYTKVQADDKFLTQDNANFLPLSGNAVSATKLATPRILSLMGEAREFDGTADIAWDVAQLGFTSAKDTAGWWGWMKRPDGFIEQWGISAANPVGYGGDLPTIFFPLAFPLKCAQIFLEGVDNANTAYYVVSSSITNTQFKIKKRIQGVTNPDYLNHLRWRAFGW